MIDYKICDKLIDLLDKEDLNGLRKYIGSERNKYYLSIARKALDKYLVRSIYAYYDCHDFSQGNLVLTDYCSAYFLESDEILTPRRKKLGNRGVHAMSYRVLDLYDKLAINQENVVEILKDATGDRDYKTLIDLKTKEGKIYTFYDDEFSFAEMFLGDDIEYSISGKFYKGGSACLVKSKKGTGFVLGRIEDKKQS